MPVWWNANRPISQSAEAGEDLGLYSEDRAMASIGVTQMTTEKDGKRRDKNLKKKGHKLLGPKKGLAIHFGHENWNMVLNMMIGIRT